MRRVFIGMLMLMLTGCATFSGELLPKDRAGEIKKGSAKVDYTARYLTDGTERVGEKGNLQSQFESVLSRTGAVSGYGAGKGLAEKHVDVEYSEESNGALFFLLSGMTAGVLPGCAWFDVAMKFDVSETGKALKSYSYKNEIKNCGHLFLMLVPGDHQDYYAARNAIVDDMTTRFLLDAQKDGAL